MEKVIFVYFPSSSLTGTFGFKVPTKVKSVYLLAYQFKGVPVTGGVPDQTFYSLVFTNSVRPDINRTDNKPGVPLPLKGTFTSEFLSFPLPISQENSIFKDCILEIQGENSQTPVFSSACFWFLIK